MKYFEEIVLAGDWNEVEKYFSGFTKLDDNEYSTRIFFEIRKQKYLEALDGQDRPKALEILCKDLKVFSTIDEDMYKQITQLLTLNNIRNSYCYLSYSGDMDNVNLLTSIDAEGGLPSVPRLRFNKEGNLLAVKTAENGIKILANVTGRRSLRTVETPPVHLMKH